MEGRPVQSIDERWTRVLDPALTRGKFSEEDDRLISLHVSEHGTAKWGDVKGLAGRGAGAIGERWRTVLDPAQPTQVKPAPAS